MEIAKVRPGCRRGHLQACEDQANGGVSVDVRALVVTWGGEDCRGGGGEQGWIVG